MMERRQSKRFDLRLPVEIVRRSFQPVSSIGEIRNISAGGVLLRASVPLEVGEPIEYLVTLLPRTPGGNNVSLRCLGKVVRIEDSASATRDESGLLLGVTLERHEFLRS